MRHSPARPNAPAPRLRYAFQMVDRQEPSPRKRVQIKEEILYTLGISLGIEDILDTLDITRGNWDQALEHLLSFESRLTRNTSLDAYIPWLTREVLSRYHAPRHHHADFPYSKPLPERFQGICIWAAENKIDLNKYTTQEALDASADYVSRAERKARLMDDPENPIVYRFPDGYHVRELRTPKALHSDGEIVQNCLRHGNYDEAVAHGESIIYSLRDEKGLPHVDMEWQTGDIDLPGHTEQVFGKQNQKPDAKYVPYLEEFIRNSPVMLGDTRGLLLAGVPVRKIDLRNAFLDDVDLTGADLSGTNLTGAHLTRALLVNTFLRGSRLIGAHLQRADLTASDLMGALLQRARLQGADLTDALLNEANLTKADLTAADLTMANLSGAVLEGACLRRARLDAANLTGADLRGVDLDWANLTDANLEGANLEGASLHETFLMAALWDSSTIWPKGFTPPARNNPRRNAPRCTIHKADDLDAWGDPYSTDMSFFFEDNGIEKADYEDPYEVCVNASDEVVAASTFGYRHDGLEGSFSVVVEPEHRRTGVARLLVQRILDAHPGVEMVPWVVSDEMARLLESLGFEWDREGVYMWRNGRSRR